MPKTLPEIIYDKNKVTPIIDSRNSLYQIPFYKPTEYFSNIESYTNFIKSVERLVRTNDRYSKYIDYLKKEIKLDHCQVLSGLNDQDCDIEMHHGPIFNLFDYCAIVLEYFLMKQWKVTTFRIADTVLDEHQKNRVQIVMLSSTVHQEVHAREIFINYKQAWGDLNAFINKYGVAMSDEHKEKLNRYIDRSLIRDSDDFGILELSDLVQKL